MLQIENTLCNVGESWHISYGKETARIERDSYSYAPARRNSRKERVSFATD